MIKESKKIAGLAVLLAIHVLLSRIAIGPDFAKISLAFIPLVIAGYFYGSVANMFMCMLANIIVFTIFSTGTFSPFFLFSAALAGLVYGLLKKPTITRIVLVNLVVVVGISFFLNTAIISFSYHVPLEGLLLSRAIRTTITLVIQIAISIPLLKNSAIQQFKNKMN